MLPLHRDLNDMIISAFGSGRSMAAALVVVGNGTVGGTG